VTTEARDETAGEKETGRLEALSDGVFAVALTLLVTTLDVPSLTGTPSVSSLLHALGHQWLSYLAYATSFATILIMWTHHRAIFKVLHHTDALLMFANGLLLLLVTLVPFPTHMVAEYLRTPAGGAAAAVYAATFATADLIYNLLWWAAMRDRRRLRPDVTHLELKVFRPDYLLGFLPYVLAVAVAFWNPYVSVGICFLMWIVWGLTGRVVTPWTTGRRGRGQAGQDAGTSCGRQP
jgi:uncharacterized membrane protein